MKISKAVKALLLSLIVTTTTLSAQQQMQMPQVAPADSVSEQELETFVDVAMDIQGIRMEMDQLVMARLDEEGMTTERFQQIMQSKQNPNAPALQLSTKEEQTVANMQSYLQELSTEMQQQQLEAIDNSEMTATRFQSIAMALRTDKDLAMRFQEKAAEMENS